MEIVLEGYQIWRKAVCDLYFGLLEMYCEGGSGGIHQPSPLQARIIKMDCLLSSCKRKDIDSNNKGVDAGSKTSSLPTPITLDSTLARSGRESAQRVSVADFNKTVDRMLKQAERHEKKMVLSPGTIVKIRGDDRDSYKPRGIIGIVVQSHPGGGGIVAMTDFGIVSHTNGEMLYVPYDQYVVMEGNVILSERLLKCRRSILEDTFVPETQQRFTMRKLQSLSRSAPISGKVKCRCKGGKCTRSCGCYRKGEMCSSSCSCSGRCELTKEKESQVGTKAIREKALLESKKLVRDGLNINYIKLRNLQWYSSTKPKLKWPCISVENPGGNSWSINILLLNTENKLWHYRGFKDVRESKLIPFCDESNCLGLRCRHDWNETYVRRYLAYIR
jgi:hypothetical protein